MNSIWVKIPDYPNYMVSPEGNILSLNYNKTGKARVLSTAKRSSSYREIQLRNEKGVKHTRTHRIVAEIFCEKKAHHTQVNHIDGNGQNNHYKNLEWCTSSGNIKHSYDSNPNRGTSSEKIKGVKNGRSKLSEKDVLYILSADVSRLGARKNLSIKFGVSKTVITNIIKRKIWKHIEIGGK